MVSFEEYPPEEPEVDTDPDRHIIRSMIEELIENGIFAPDYERRLDEGLEGYLGMLVTYVTIAEDEAYHHKVNFAYDLIEQYDRGLCQPLLVAADYFYPPREASEEVSQLAPYELEAESMRLSPDVYYQKFQSRLLCNREVCGVIRESVTDLLGHYGFVDDDADTNVTFMIVMIMIGEVVTDMAANSNQPTEYTRQAIATYVENNHYVDGLYCNSIRQHFVGREADAAAMLDNAKAMAPTVIAEAYAEYVRDRRQD